uniref:Endonuclease/exonuclease/phosphatase domain-containing protein n=1 Tax=Oryza meridionalis TaxID=40149 RepID=A0A0E0D1M9_9ORYZ
MSSSSLLDRIKFMTFNVWSCEHFAVYRRIRSICDIIDHHDPDEVTEYIYSIFQKASWWSKYKAMSFPRQEMETHFCVMLCVEAHEVDWPPPNVLFHLKIWRTTVHLKVRSMGGGGGGGGQMQRLGVVDVATCRLPTPTPSDVRAMERGTKASRLLDFLDNSTLAGNVVLGGDMSWDDDIDGPFPAEERSGWVDAWCGLRRGGAGGGGWTYDAVANPMLKGWRKPEMRKRPDRFLCKLRDFKLDRIEMVGVEPIQGVTHYDDKGYELPVLPSHHFGLLLTIYRSRIISKSDELKYVSTEPVS